MKTQLKPPPMRVVEQQKSGELKIGDRVEIAGPSHHQGEIVDIKNSCYSGLTYSVRIGRIIRDGIEPSALTKPC